MWKLPETEKKTLTSVSLSLCSIKSAAGFLLLCSFIHGNFLGLFFSISITSPKNVCFIPTGLPESLSVYFTGMCFIFLSLEGGGRQMRSRRVFSAFLKPTHLCSKSSFVFSPSVLSLIFIVRLLASSAKVFLSSLQSTPLLFFLLSLFFPYCSLTFFLPPALCFVPSNLQFPLYFCPVHPLISFFFHLMFYPISHFLPFGVNSPLLLLSLFHFLSHVSIFSTLNHSHPFILRTPFQPVGCLKRLL